MKIKAISKKDTESILCILISIGMIIALIMGIFVGILFFPNHITETKEIPCNIEHSGYAWEGDNGGIQVCMEQQNHPDTNDSGMWVFIPSWVKQ